MVITSYSATTYLAFELELSRAHTPHAPDDLSLLTRVVVVHMSRKHMEQNGCGR